MFIPKKKIQKIIMQKIPKGRQKIKVPIDKIKKEQLVFHTSLFFIEIYKRWKIEV